MKKLVALLAVSLSVFAVACGGGTEEAKAPESAPADTAAPPADPAATPPAGDPAATPPGGEAAPPAGEAPKH
jgi:hypothetical protein